MEHDPRPPLWCVWRTDDTGNTFLVRENLSEAEATAVVAEFTARGHTQYYFIDCLPPNGEPPVTPPAPS
jgi:hypothetical protein